MCILDDFSGFGDFDRRCPVDAGFDDRFVNFRDDIKRFFVLCGNDFFDCLERMLMIAGIDSFRRVADEEVDPGLQTGCFFKDRNTIFFRCSRVDGRLVDDDVPFVQLTSDKMGSTQERRQIWLILRIDRCRNGDDDEIARTKCCCVRHVFDVGIFQDERTEFERRINALFQFSDALFFDVKADDFRFFAKGDGDGKTDISETDDGNRTVGDGE